MGPVVSERFMTRSPQEGRHLLSPRIQIRLKELGKAGFDKQPFSYGAFGSGCSYSRD